MQSESTTDSLTVNYTGFIEQLPLSQNFEFDKFYVRECYAEYYTHLMDQLKAKTRTITVTGTPGIGISMFYLYFVNRYRNENQDKTIVTASFDQFRQVISCVVFKPDKEPEYYNDKIPNIPDSIHFYDGPPTRPLHGRQQLIAFTSPNYAWLNMIRKEMSKCTFYMPLWTLNELNIAAALLELDLDEENIQERFDFFGGTARICFQSKDDISDERSSFITAISGINSYQMVSDYLTQDTLYQDISHRIFHYQPLLNQDNLPRRSSRLFCSKQVATLVSQRLINASEYQKREFISIMKMLPYGQSCFGWIFEDIAHERLHGMNQMRLLQLPQPQIKTLEVQNISNLYQKASTSTNASFDSYIFKQDTMELLLFQMTVSERRPIKGDGIIDFLQIKNLVNASNLKIYLIFVVPDDSKLQQLQDVQLFNVVQAQESVSKIKNIGAKTELRLKSSQSIISVGQLIDAIDRGQSFEAKIINAVRNFLDDQERLEVYNNILGRISQFVLPIELNLTFK